MTTPTFSRLLGSNSRFRNLWFGQVISELGNWFNFIAELGLVRALSGSALSASAIIASHLVPFCIFGPVAGAVADRFPRKTIMLAADLTRAAVALGFLYVTTADRLWAAYLCAGLISLIGVFFEAAKNASMPNLAQNEQLLPANALMHATRFLQMAIGSVLGGLASEAFGYQTAFAINAASFLISAAFVWRIPADDLEGDRSIAPADVKTTTALTRDLGEAVGFIRSNPLVLGISALNVGWAMGGGMMAVINDRFGGIVFAAEGRSGDTGVAILSGSAGLGLMLGMMISRHVAAWAIRRDNVGSFMGWAIAFSGLIFGLSSFMPNIWLMGAVFIVNRLLLSAEYAVQETVLMVALPNRLRGKVHTIDRSLELATMAVSAIVAGGLFSVLPPRAVPMIAAVLMGLPGFFWLLALSSGRLRVTRAALGA